MSLRNLATTCSAASAFALALALATPAAAAGSDGPGDAASLPAAPAMPMPMPMPMHAPGMPGGPDMRPVWQGSASAPGRPDERTRDAWLRECHRRTEFYYDGWGKRHRRGRRGDHHSSEPGYSYCEAYFDDYYRTYAQPGYAHAYAAPMMGYVRPLPMAHAPMAQASGPCEEVVTTEYVPVRSRFIPRRPAPRRVPDKRQRMD